MTREDLLADRTMTPLLNNEQFARALLLANAEVAAEGYVRKRRRRGGRRAKPRDLMSDDMDGVLTGADVAELLAGA